MILTAHQPGYWPWLGLFHKISLADMFCVFDDVQYEAKGFHNRNKIKTNAGPIWLSVPVESKNHFNCRIKDIKIINNGWNKKHFKSISMAYQKSAYFKCYIGDVEEILMGREYERLVDLNVAVLLFCLRSLNINIPIVKASDHSFQGKKSDLVLDMCLNLKASAYIFGSQGRDYADVAGFESKGVRVYFQEYKHPCYTQLHGEFEPCMSILDLLFNEGPRSVELIRSGNEVCI